MNVENVMDEEAAALRTVSGLEVHPYDEEKINPPAAIVAFPKIKYDLTYGRGMDEYTQVITLFVSMIGGAETRRASLAPYMNGSGKFSIKQALERHRYTSCDVVQVRSAEPLLIKLTGVVYLAVRFSLYITGQGG